MKTTKYTFQNTDKELWELESPSEGIVYISINDKWAVLYCPCGCGDRLCLNMMQGTKPCWIIIDGNTIKPSINKLTGCKSHFHIIKGTVYEAGTEPK